MTIRIAVDCMGGDHGIAVTIPACVSFLRSESGAYLLLVGRQADIEPALSAALGGGDSLRQRLEIVDAPEVVEMDEAPASALRGKRRSSMRLAIEAVRDARADACLSAGNTGALMAISRFVLKMLPDIERPAIAFQLPNRSGGTTTMLDLGANVDCEPGHLFQFGLMGSALVTALEHRESPPTVALLNIGEELIKGNDTVKQAGALLRESSLNYIGYAEGDDIYAGNCDVIVCDGFVGNVALKTSEGLAQMMGAFIREEFSRNWISKLMALAAAPVLRRFKRRVDPDRYNGAALVGLRGVVFKSHGSASLAAFEAALRRAYDAADNRLLDRIRASLDQVRANSNDPAGSSSVVLSS
ncbi:MAG: phosphate acyltransferase PlsX [Burkholderiaceae bacterium]